MALVIALIELISWSKPSCHSYTLTHSTAAYGAASCKLAGSSLPSPLRVVDLWLQRAEPIHRFPAVAGSDSCRTDTSQLFVLCTKV